MNIVKQDLNKIINTCRQLKHHPSLQGKPNKYNFNRAYKILLILKDEFSEELSGG